MLALKKSFYIFHIIYEGKPSQYDKWRRKVEQKCTTTLKFMNTARLLKIIGYEPKRHLRKDQINLDPKRSQKVLGRRPLEGHKIGPHGLRDASYDPVERSRKSILESQQTMRSGNLQHNMSQIIGKFAAAGNQMRDMADEFRKFSRSAKSIGINSLPSREQQHLQVLLSARREESE